LKDAYLSRQPDKIQTYKSLVHEYFESIDLPRQPASLYEPIRYTLAGEGKRLRPVLVLLACDAVGGVARVALPAAAAIELMHNFTLVHDDIMDRDDTRRGRPTVHRKWDSDVALLAGDGLVALAYRHLLQTETTNLARIARSFTDGIIEICEGQALDHDFEGSAHVKMADYLDMITRKTARLLAISASIGGVIGNGTERQIELLTAYAENLGIAFQIQDDLLDITVEQHILGKDFGSDIKRHKRTFLVIHALQHGTPHQQRHLQKVLETPELTMDDILKVRDLFGETGSLQSAAQIVGEYISRSQAALGELSNSANVQGLHMLLDIILRRNA
jgi:geranylgeranyl diphosphate synthase type II